MSDEFKAYQAATALAGVPGAAARLRSFAPPPAPTVATRQGQREIVAATLAAGLIAADHGRAPTVEAAVGLMREVMAVAWPE